MKSFVRTGFVIAVLVNCVVVNAEVAKPADPQPGSQAVRLLDGTANDGDGVKPLGRFSTGPDNPGFSRPYTLEDYVIPAKPTLKESFDTMVSSVWEFVGSLCRFVFRKHILMPAVLILIMLSGLFRK
jgi:hypothetical protein